MTPALRFRGAMRLAVLLTVIALLAGAPAASAQGDPFGPLPPPAPEPTPEPEPLTDPNKPTPRTTLVLVAGGVLLAFFGIGWAITRDARRSLPDDERRDLERTDVRHAQRSTAKTKARQKAKAQRAARKKTKQRRR